MIELKIDKTNENLEKLKFYKNLINTVNKNRKHDMEIITRQAIDYQI